MRNPGLPEELWSTLYGRLWHATDCDSLSGIFADCEIKPRVGDRYKSSFCRCRDSVSLFDFGSTAFSCQGQFENWVGWFGRQQEARVAIWLEIDRDSSVKHLLAAGAAHSEWKKEKKEECQHFIPGVEACHQGPIPLAAVVGVLLIDQHNRSLFARCDERSVEIFQQIKAFELGLPPPPPSDPVVEALLTGGQRNAERAKLARTASTGNALQNEECFDRLRCGSKNA